MLYNNSKTEKLTQRNESKEKFFERRTPFGANHTVGAGTSNDSDWDEDFARTVTLKAGDVIYLATTSVTPGYVDVTLTPVAE